MPWQHPVRTLPLTRHDVANELEAEFASWPLGRRWQLLRKAIGREAALLLGGQARLRRQQVPPGVRRMLWDYSWTTVGDAVLDLAPRSLIPPAIEVDLLIAPHLAPLFATDSRIRRVFSSQEEIDAPYDLVLLDSLRSSSLRRLARQQPKVPFATMREHNSGERFDRAAFADRRLRQLFALPDGEVVAPTLDLGSDAPAQRGGGSGSLRIGVALGARLSAKLYPRWPSVLQAIVAGWPDPFRAPRFVLVGSGESALAQRDQIKPAFMAAYCSDRIDIGSVRAAAIELAGCDAFLGVDGGLMHLAVAVGTPGLALFTGIDPRYFLRPASSMRALAAKGRLESLPVASVAAAFLETLAALDRR